MTDTPETSTPIVAALSRHTSIAIVSGKGGTGKSILAASFGYLLARIGVRTLLIDADVFTSGLSFYVLADRPFRISVSMQDILMGSGIVDDLEPIPVRNDSVRGELSILASVRGRRVHGSERKISAGLNDLASMGTVFQHVVKQAHDRWGFELVIIDTRGGSDITSLACAAVADGHIVVTEADKTSWDVGEVLLGGIDDAARELGTSPERLGFVINKNVLPSAEIERFLRLRWDTPHLGTVPLDVEAVKLFQEDKIPVAESLAIPFSRNTVPIVPKLVDGRDLSVAAKRSLDELVQEASLAARESQEVKSTLDRSVQFGTLVRAYGTIIAMLLLAFLGFNTVMRGVDSVITLLTVLVASVLIFTMAASDQSLLQSLLRTVFPFSATPSTKASAVERETSEPE